MFLLKSRKLKKSRIFKRKVDILMSKSKFKESKGSADELSEVRQFSSSFLFTLT